MNETVFVPARHKLDVGSDRRSGNAEVRIVDFQCRVMDASRDPTTAIVLDRLF